MRASLSLAITALLAAVAAASSTRFNQFLNPPGGYTFTAGQPTALSWQANTPGSVSLYLEWGQVTTPSSGMLIACKCGRNATEILLTN